MIASLIEILLSAIGEGLFQLVCELILDSGGRVLRSPDERPRRMHPIVAAVGLLLLGGLIGILMSLVFPQPLITRGPVPGASLILSPLLTASAMEIHGRWRERHGMSRSYLATFWGGGLFAFGMAAARFVMVGGWAS